MERLRMIGRLALAILMVGIVVFAAVEIVRDAVGCRGAFAKSGDVYPVTAANYRAAAEAEKTAVPAVYAVPAEEVTVPKAEAAEIAVLEVGDELQTGEEEVLALPDTAGETAGATSDRAAEERAALGAATETQADQEGHSAQYVVAGCVCPLEVAEALRSELKAAGIEWWLPFALCTAFQESRFRADAVSRDGRDKGLFQYREKYWDASNGDILDYRAQIRLYVQQTANRLSAGCTIQETVSRHMMSDYGEINQEYVYQVLRWADTVVIPNWELSKDWDF